MNILVGGLSRPVPSLVGDTFDCVTDAVVSAAAAAAAVPATQGGRCLVIPRQSQAAVLQSAGGLQQVPRHHEGVQVTDVR